MAAATPSRKSEILADDVLAQLDADIQSASCLSLAIDKSKDVTMSSFRWMSDSP